MKITYTLQICKKTTKLFVLHKIIDQFSDKTRQNAVSHEKKMNLCYMTLLFIEKNTVCLCRATLTNPF